MKQIITASLVAALLICSGCVSGLELHNQLKSQVKLGMSKTDFDLLMEPVQKATKGNQLRSEELYTEGNSVMAIVFIRTDWIRDGALTDDEYTPYVFRDNRLVAFGWRSIGGMKVTSRDIAKAKSGATKINVSQQTNVGTSVPTFCVPDLNGDGRCMGGKCC